MLSVKNLTKEYKNVIAVNDISFQVEPGKIFGLLGPNGAGKTTTIRIILNIIKPTSGIVSFEGKPITHEFVNDLGYLPEERGLYKKSTVFNVINYFASLKNLSKNEISKRAGYWLDRLGIANYRDNNIEELSKGNQQKVQFITAIIHDPKLLILDEPFSGFDPINQQLIRETILSFVNSGKVVILSTHQMDTAEKLCSDILLLNKGKEVCKGNLTKIKQDFGTNNVKIEFEGNASFLSSLPEVKSVDLYGVYAEVHLNKEVQRAEFLKKIADKLLINQFSVIEPTLNKIFIDAINISNKK